MKILKCKNDSNVIQELIKSDLQVMIKGNQTKKLSKEAEKPVKQSSDTQVTAKRVSGQQI